MQEDYDAIVVSNYVEPKKSLSNLVKQMTFVPSTIYKTELVTSTVIINAQFNLHSMFAQLAMAISLINDNKKIYICDKWIVNNVPHGGEETYARGLAKKDMHPILKNMIWYTGYMTALQLIKDKNLRYMLIQDMSLDDRNFSCTCFCVLSFAFFTHNYINAYTFFGGLSLKQKSVFISQFMRIFIGNYFILVYPCPKGTRVKLFGCLKFLIKKKKNDVKK